MIRKTIAFLILVPLAAVIVTLAVANRHAITLSLDPVSAAPTLSVTLPLFVVLLLALLVGVIVGGTAAWLRQGKWRRTARRMDAEVRRLRAENDTLKVRIEAGERAAAPGSVTRRLPAA